MLWGALITFIGMIFIIGACRSEAEDETFVILGIGIIILIIGIQMIKVHKEVPEEPTIIYKNISELVNDTNNIDSIVVYK